MKWNRGGQNNLTLRIPGDLGAKATIIVHSETIVITLMIGGETVRKWGIPAPSGVDEAKRQVEGLLNGLADGIWEA